MRNILVFSFYLLVSTVAWAGSPTDSIRAAESQLTAIVKEAHELSVLIVTPDDKERYSLDISLVEKRMSRLEQDYPIVVTDEYLSQLYKQYLGAMKTIEDNLVRYRRGQVQDSLERIMARWSPRFDSLLVVGAGYAEKKEADSVRMVKSQADEWWTSIGETHRTYSDHFDADETLRQHYQHIEETRGEIRNLSEKERIKLRDILLVGGVLVGVVAIVGGMLGAKIKSKKLLKKAQEIPSIEL
ncbi:MAG: hypothetical protein J6X88_08990 [Bacteroidales bacterium]|nr:hypothetical protein [Bacteroidales bacterium]